MKVQCTIQFTCDHTDPAYTPKLMAEDIIWEIANDWCLEATDTIEVVPNYEGNLADG